MKKLSVLVTLVVLAALAVTACAPAAPAAEKPGAGGQAAAGGPLSSADWNKVVEAAKKEGNVTAYGSVLGAEENDALSRAFKDKYGITLDWVIGSADESREKIQTEAAVGTRIGDVMINGAGAPWELYSTGFSQPFNIPEAEQKDKFWMDPYVLDFYNNKGYITFFLYSQPSVLVNTQQVTKDLDSWYDLLDPKWKGKIVMRDPRGSGPGNETLTTIIKQGVPAGQIGKDWLDGFVQQKPMFIKQSGQDHQWVADGKAAMSLAPDIVRSTNLIQAGAPVKMLYFKEGNRLSGRSAMLIKDAPHPNAAKLLVNWILSKEGQEIISKVCRVTAIRKEVSQDAVPEIARYRSDWKYWFYTLETMEGKNDSYKFFKEQFGAD